jgi:hypothetical protein
MIKSIISIMFVTTFGISVYGQVNYYVDATNGNDNNSGTTV